MKIFKSERRRKNTSFVARIKRGGTGKLWHEKMQRRPKGMIMDRIALVLAIIGAAVCFFKGTIAKALSR